MNTPNNKRKRDSQEKIEKTFLQLIQKKNITEISVSTICEIAKLNRSTFYANYIDVYDLVEKVKRSHSADEAQRIAYANRDKQRADWNEVKLKVMEELLRLKIEQNPYVKKKLLQTKDYLISCKKTTNPNLSPIGKKFGFECFGAVVLNGFEKINIKQPTISHIFLPYQSGTLVFSKTIN